MDIDVRPGPLPIVPPAKLDSQTSIWERAVACVLEYRVTENRGIAEIPMMRRGTGDDPSTGGVADSVEGDRISANYAVSIGEYLDTGGSVA